MENENEVAFQIKEDIKCSLGSIAKIFVDVFCQYKKSKSKKVYIFEPKKQAVCRAFNFHCENGCKKGEKSKKQLELESGEW